MRLAIAVLLGAASLAPLALAQTPPEPPAAAAPAPAPPAATPSTVTPPTPTTPDATTATPPVAAAPAPPEATTPSAVTPSATTTPGAAPAPPPPPPPPTDPTAIALLGTLHDICMPMVDGGNFAKLAKAAHFRKSGDNWTYKGADFEFTVLAPQSNPNICQVELVHPVDQAEPAKPLVVALHNWAVFDNGWSLDRNDKHVSDNQEFITRSWVHSADGKHEALVLTTIRKADDTPTSRKGDTSEMFYSVTKDAS